MKPLTAINPQAFSPAFQRLLWPITRLGEAMTLLANASKLSAQIEMEAPNLPENLSLIDRQRLNYWVIEAGERLGVEIESLEITYGTIEKTVKSVAPAILELQQGEQTFLLVLLGYQRQKAIVLTPTQSRQQVPIDWIKSALCQPLELPLQNEISQILDFAQIPAQNRQQTYRAILQQRLNHRPLQVGWRMKLSSRSGFFQQIWHAGLVGDLAFFALTHTLRTVVWLLSWYMIGRSILQDGVSSIWLWGWAFLIIALIPLRALIPWWHGRISIKAGAFLKQRLLIGALRLHPDEIRHQGVGQLLGRIVESEAIEMQATQGGFFAVNASIDLLSAFVVLSFGAGGGIQALLLLIWIFVAGFVGWRYYQQRIRWTDARLVMTHTLVEKMVGHRTRLAQEPSTLWHGKEERSLANYYKLAANMDGKGTQLLAVMGKGWLVVSSLFLIPTFVNTQSPALLAVTIGGIITAYQAMRGLANGFLNLAWATIAWRQIADIFYAAERPAVIGDPAISASESEQVESTIPVLKIANANYRYGERRELVLQSCSLTIHQGERILLEGVSGGGKSTLVALITGLRQPDSGLRLLNGFDYHTLGDSGWRRRVAAAPQFHENHVLTESFAFNLLMGREWPPHEEDLKLAEEICRELGLGELLERMPGGMFQMVGDTGWQLSHGERSRLYIARALLQKAELVVFDESFAALDPDNLRRAIECVCERSPTLLVIAHP